VSAWTDQRQRLADRIDALSLRERALIFLAVALVLIVSVNLLLIDPLLTRSRNLQQRIVQEELQIKAMRAQIEESVAASTADPDADLRLRLESLRLQSEQAAETLQDIQSGLVPPQRIPALLQDLLRHNRSVSLVAMKTLPVETLGVATTAAASVPPAGAAAGERTEPPAGPMGAVYKHGVEITVQGSYLDLLRYLEGIEALPWQMFWGTADVDGKDYPTVTLTLRLYTLSLDEAWLTL
jgi:MSHA biogenesis protein MshJ